MAFDFSAVTCLSGARALQLAIHDGSIEEIALQLEYEAEELSCYRKDENLPWYYHCDDDPCDHHTALELAACSGQIGALERLLEAGADRKAQLHYYETSVLEKAAGRGQLVAVQKLLEKGADPNHYSRSVHSPTPLIAATRAGHVEVSKCLLHTGADVSISYYRYEGDVSAISVAAEVSSLSLLELYLGAVTDAATGFDADSVQVAIAEGQQEDRQALVDKKIFLQRARKSINDALSVAARAGDILILERLLDADVGGEAHNGITAAIAAAAAGGHLNAMTKLLQAASDQACLSEWFLTKALQSAVNAGHIALIQPLLEAGANVTHVDINLAATRGYFDVLAFFVESGTSVEGLHNTGISHVLGTPLQWAMKGGHLAEVDFLLTRGADVNAPPTTKDISGPGGTVLQIAIASGHMEMARRLLDEGADVNALPVTYRDIEDSDTALQAAARAGNITMLETLLAAGATVDTGYQDRTALSVAAEANHPEIVARLLALMSPEDARQTASLALYRAVRNRHTQIVHQLLQCHPDVDFYGKQLDRPEPYTMLQVAAANGDLEIVKLLLGEKADVNLKNPFQSGRKTSLQSASACGFLDGVKLLLAADAEVNVIGSTAPPLLLAIRNGHVEVFELLLAAGADIRATSYLGQTMLEAAEDSGDMNMQKRLRDALQNTTRLPQEEQPPDKGRGPLCETCRYLAGSLIEIDAFYASLGVFHNKVTGDDVHHDDPDSDNSYYSADPPAYHAYNEKSRETFTLHSLPQIFNDAFQVAARMGVKYIWIDSLCITQDDPKDWNHEASMMSYIYTNAYFTIAISTPSTQDQIGLFRRRDITTARFSHPAKDGSDQEILVMDAQREQQTFWESNLLTRGWCFQERELSRRIVHYTGSQALNHTKNGRNAKVTKVK
ncbi:hypothetical protein N0V82_005682 [Gnomoniopsis sp. IMI 355080]|nr:hypothetical protein N0V82_005682 [Gnomoniopsis sp. IMI 355080]